MFTDIKQLDDGHKVSDEAWVRNPGLSPKPVLLPFITPSPSGEETLRQKKPEIVSLA